MDMGVTKKSNNGTWQIQVLLFTLLYFIFIRPPGSKKGRCYNHVLTSEKKGGHTKKNFWNVDMDTDLLTPCSILLLLPHRYINGLSKTVWVDWKSSQITRPGREGNPQHLKTALITGVSPLITSVPSSLGWGWLLNLSQILLP